MLGTEDQQSGILPRGQRCYESRTCEMVSGIHKTPLGSTVLLTTYLVEDYPYRQRGSQSLPTELAEE